jgi:hypothetical protein
MWPQVLQWVAVERLGWLQKGQMEMRSVRSKRRSLREEVFRVAMATPNTRILIGAAMVWSSFVSVGAYQLRAYKRILQEVSVTSLPQQRPPIACAWTYFAMARIGPIRH